MDPDDDVVPLRLLASAIAGRTLDVAPADEGDRSWTDGRTIFLGAGSGPERIQMLGVQASLVAAGSLAPAVLRQLVRRPAVARRYLALDAHRALALNEDVLPPIVRAVLDHELAAELPDAAASLTVARSRRPLDDPGPVLGMIDVKRALAAMERAATASARVDDGPAIAPAHRAEATAELDDADLDEPGHLGDLLTSPVGGGGPIGRLLSRLVAPARSRGEGGAPGAGAPMRLITTRPGENRRTPSSVALVADPGAAAWAAHRGTSYPEWDVHHARYRPDWCTVREAEPDADPTSASTMFDGLGLGRPMARLGMGLTQCRRRPHGDEVDIDAAVEAWIDTRAGSPHDENVYLESLRRRRDLSVLVLLDVSGSAAEPGPTGGPVHRQQVMVAGALTTALHELGDRVALYAFNSRGRQAVVLLRVKRFDDPLDATVARRLDGLRPGAYTRLGAAIRHGTTILVERSGTPRRLLVVLSDGFAYDHGYDGRYAEADARRALSEARRTGVGCLCLSVGSDGDPAALQRVFGAASHAMVPYPDELPRLIGPLFRSALRRAEAQQRTYERRQRRGHTNEETARR